MSDYAGTIDALCKGDLSRIRFNDIADALEHLELQKRLLTEEVVALRGRLKAQPPGDEQ